jgi:hypothetical protein
MMHKRKGLNRFGWVMWNAQMSGLLNGTSGCLFDGNPAGAAFYADCGKSELDLSALPGLSSVRALGSTGSPLSEEAQIWGTRLGLEVNLQPLEVINQEAMANPACLPWYVEFARERDAQPNLSIMPVLRESQ